VLCQFQGILSTFKGKRLEKNHEKYQTGQPLTIPNTGPGMECGNKRINKIKMKQILNFLTQPEQVFQCAVVMVLFSNVVTPGQNFCHYLVGKVSHSNSVLP